MLALFLPKQGPKRAIFKHFTFFFQNYSIIVWKWGGGDSKVWNFDWIQPLGNGHYILYTLKITKTNLFLIKMDYVYSYARAVYSLSL